MMLPLFASAVEWFSSHAIRLAVIGALSMALGVGIYMRGQESAAIKCASSNAEVIVKEVEKHNENHEAIQKMPISELDSALDEFVRPDD